jgi:hypothetical protein
MGYHSKAKIIKLKIVNCTVSTLDRKPTWYANKIGRKLKFFNEIFEDSDEILSVWRAEIPVDRYVYLKDTNYNSYIRKQKLKKINGILYKDI